MTVKLFPFWWLKPTPWWPRMLTLLFSEEWNFGPPSVYPLRHSENWTYPEPPTLTLLHSEAWSN